MKTKRSNDILRLSNEESNKITRECLMTAMFKLVGEKDFEKITVTEIARRAGVSRLAFYRNYETKELLVTDMCRILLQKLTASLKSERFRTDRKRWYADFFRTIQEHRTDFQAYLNANLTFSEGVLLESAFPAGSVTEHYRRAAQEGAFRQVLLVWFKDGMKESAEEMAAMCMEVL